jgi:hypothetical protein
VDQCSYGQIAYGEIDQMWHSTRTAADAIMYALCFQGVREKEIDFSINVMYQEKSWFFSDRSP